VPKLGREERHNEGDRPWKNLSELALISPRTIFRSMARSKMHRFFSQIEPSFIGMEACGSAHYWARELKATGHDVLLMPPSYIKPYVKRGKNDAVDAEAISLAPQMIATSSTKPLTRTSRKP
jgi:transposase